MSFLGAVAAAATRTSELGTSVTLLANADPVRIAEDLATLDVLSGGRAEATFARGVDTNTMTAFGIVMHNFFIFFNAAIGLVFLRRATRELFG